MPTIPMGSESFSLAEWKSVHIISADNSKSSFWSDVLRIVHICPHCQLSAIKLRISTMGMLMGWVFLPIGDRDELLLFLGTGWNVFLCWTTKNSQQWFHISIWWQRWQWIFSWPYDKDLFGFDKRLWRRKKLQILVLNPMSFQAELHLGHTILSCLGMSYVFEVIFSTFRSFSLSAHACGFRWP